jgi:hypothetical protein
VNRHAMLDRITIPVTQVFLGGYKLFGESHDSPGFAEHLTGIESHLPERLTPGAHEVAARTARGQLDPGFFVARWLGAGYPTILYHHGNNERPFDFGRFSKNSFKRVLLDAGHQIPASIIGIRAPWHRSIRQYMRAMAHLSNFTGMMAVSAWLIEGLIDRVREQGAEPVTVSGFSLGGWITNLHRAMYGTADVYVPMAAGTALDDTVLDSIWGRTVSATLQQDPVPVRQALNFEREFAARPQRNVFPLLGRYDQYIRHDVQTHAYGVHPVRTLDKGHITLLADAPTLREHLLAHLGSGERSTDSPVMGRASVSGLLADHSPPGPIPASGSP